MQLCLLQSESQLHFGECGTWKPYKPLQALNTIRLISQTGSIFISILILSQFETSFEYNINLVFFFQYNQTNDISYSGYSQKTMQENQIQEQDLQIVNFTAKDRRSSNLF